MLTLGMSRVNKLELQCSLSLKLFLRAFRAQAAPNNEQDFHHKSSESPSYSEKLKLTLKDFPITSKRVSQLLSCLSTGNLCEIDFWNSVSSRTNWRGQNAKVSMNELNVMKVPALFTNTRHRA